LCVLRVTFALSFGDEPSPLQIVNGEVIKRNEVAFNAMLSSPDLNLSLLIIVYF